MSATKPFTIDKWLVYEAYKAVKAKGGSAGVDQQSLEDFEAELKDNLYRVWNRMSSGSYFPAPVKAVAIPKKGGGERILGVPTVADRVAQMVVKQVIEPAIEAVFLPNSYGYRPGRVWPRNARTCSYTGNAAWSVILLDGSGVNREVHAPFYERPGVQFLRPTHQPLCCGLCGRMTPSEEAAWPAEST